ncbi:MAG: hypothetical protein IT317_14585 [Anaerolineales bacterium]|nr:hypothetical protein [Anaerolineales bacterium]
MARRPSPLLPSVLLLSLACAFFAAPAAPTPPPPATPAAPAATITERPPTAQPAAATATPGESSTAVPTVTIAAPPASPAPTRLNPAPPYVLFQNRHAIWLTNPDGSFPTQLYAASAEAETAIESDLRASLSPAGDQLALVVASPAGLDLVLVAVPSGEARTLAHLSDFTSDAELQNPASPAAFAKYAVRDYPSLAWQPGTGRLLAFIGVIDGPTADLYLYDTATAAIAQMTDGPSQAVLPSWSPDGQYLLQAGVSWVEPLGGALGPANHLDGVWAVRLSDGALLDQPRPAGVVPHNLGWTDAAHYLIYDSDDECFARDLRSVEVTTGAETPILPGSFYFSAARSPENGALLFSGAAGCADSVGEGTFLLLPGQTTPTQLDTQRAYEVAWLPESRVFQAYPEALYSADGQTRFDPPVYDASFYGAVSAAGDQAWLVIQDRKGRLEVRTPGGDWQTVLPTDISRHLWGPGGSRLLLMVTADGELYSAAYPDFSPVDLGSLGGPIDAAVWVPAPPAQ